MKNKTARARLTEGDIKKTLIRLTGPMVVGMASMMVFNITDTYFVGKLGTDQLAAMSFTFPVVLFIASLAMGLGLGTTAIVSHAVGENDQEKVKRITTDSLMLSLVIVAIFALTGLMTIKPLFSMLGAKQELMPYITRYMRIWYMSLVVVVVPMVGNNAIRSLGDTKTPALIMTIAAAFNIILDPLLIFGIGIFPRLELAGAAIATLISRAVALFISLYILIHREEMLTFKKTAFQAVVNSWKQILFIGLPTAGSRMLAPVALAVITRMVASYGKEYVAAFGVSCRIEFFAMAVIVALTSVLGPFVGQNWGAGKYDRVYKGVAFSRNFCFTWGFFMYALLFVTARPLAGLFSKNPVTIATVVLYLKIAAAGLGFHGLLHLAISVLNVVKKPIHAANLTVIQLFLLYIPLAYIGSYFWGITGIISSIAASYVFGGIIAQIMMRKTLNTVLA
ncbi:MAG: MATE family efflux transporter [Elusimicrobiota bacterium]